MRGGAEQFMEETERSLHDAIMIARRAIKNDAVVAGTYLFYITLVNYKIHEIKFLILVAQDAVL